MSPDLQRRIGLYRLAHSRHGLPPIALRCRWRDDVCEHMGLAWCAHSGAWWHLVWGDEVCRGEGVRCG